MTKTLKDYIAELDTLEFKNMFNNDFFLTWEHTPEELEAVFTVADTLRHLREYTLRTGRRRPAPARVWRCSSTLAPESFSSLIHSGYSAAT